ncbi:MAG: DUF302 domain-containing protein [Bacteroidetes bacterium]|nr:DUF302 domain-containing protein [Bacteroidota bacterium]
MPSYAISRTLDRSFEDTIQHVTEALKTEGFGILTEIDIRETLKEKLDVDFRPYRILGACNPALAHQALQVEPHIGLMLPCNVIVQDAGEGKTEVSAVDPVASMSAIENEALGDISMQVRARLERVIESL